MEKRGDKNVRRCRVNELEKKGTLTEKKGKFITRKKRRGGG